MELILSYFSVSPMLTLVSFVGLSFNNLKKSRLSECLDELLSAPKIAPFLANSLPKLNASAPLNTMLFFF